MNPRQIGEALGLKADYVGRLIQKELRATAQEYYADVRTIYNEEMEKLDWLESKLRPLIDPPVQEVVRDGEVVGVEKPKPDLNAVEKMVQVMKHRATLTGLSKRPQEQARSVQQIKQSVNVLNVSQAEFQKQVAQALLLADPTLQGDRRGIEPGTETVSLAESSDVVAGETAGGR